MKIFGNRKDTFTYRSDAQLKEALCSNDPQAFSYVFERYDPLLKKNIETAFHAKTEDAEKMFKTRCNELHDALVDNACAKLSLYDPASSSFDVWLAITSLKFFKKTFCEENTTLVERYRDGDSTVVFRRYKSDFEEKIRLSGEKSYDVIGENAKDLAHNLYLHLFEDNCRRLNTYDPSKQSFDAWFRRVLHNYSIDQYKKTKKNEEEVIDSGGFVRIDDMGTYTSWETSVIDPEDEEKKALLQELRELLESLEPPRYREVLIALYFDGEKYEDIAKRHKVTVDNLYNITKRALDRFRTLCKEHGLRY